MTFFLLVSSLGLCASGKPQFSIQISVPGTTYAAGAEVDIDVAITNLSDSAMPMPLETTPPVIVGCEFVLTRSGSGLEGAVEMTPYLWTMKRLTGRLSEKERAIAFDQNISPGILHGGEVELSPGQTIHYTALLNDLYKIGSVPELTISGQSITEQWTLQRPNTTASGSWVSSRETPTLSVTFEFGEL